MSYFKYFISILIVVFFLTDAFCQQLPIFTQYRQYQSYLNPASFNHDYMTDKYNLSAGLSIRNQWTRVKGTPQTNFAFGEYIYNPNNGYFGIVSGINIINDNTNPFSLNGVYGRVGTMLSNDMDFGAFSVGLTFGAAQYRFNATKINNNNNRSGKELPLDPLLQQDYSKWFPDVGAGVFFMQELYGGTFDGDVVYAGLSVPQIFGFDYQFEYNSDVGVQTLGVKRIQHYFANVGYYKYLENDSFVEFSSWIKYTGGRKTVHGDFNIRGSFNDIFWIGTGISTTGNLHLEAGFNLGEKLYLDNNLKIGYGHDFPFTNFGPRFGPTHEINLAYSFETR